MPVLPLVASITVWPGFSSPASRRLDDAERQAVLDRAQRIEGLDLDEQIGTRRRQPVDPHHWRVADRLKDVLVLALHGGLCRASV
jgi:hypothetical protein